VVGWIDIHYRSVASHSYVVHFTLILLLSVAVGLVKVGMGGVYTCFTVHFSVSC